jgi:nucleoredoxin
MDLIKSQTFVRADGSTLEADTALSNKELVLIYFSANWCPPSKSFTPILKEFYDVVAKEGVEIINVSWDQSSEEMLNYMKESHGDWLALKHDTDDSKGKEKTLKKQYFKR